MSASALSLAASMARCWIVALHVEQADKVFSPTNMPVSD
jgi:hypothetical protein